jgi:hypothetical protein
MVKPRCPECNYTFVKSVGDICASCVTVLCQECGRATNKVKFDREIKAWICVSCYTSRHAKNHEICHYCGQYKDVSEELGVCSECEEKYLK